MESDTRRLAIFSVCLGIILVTVLPEHGGYSRGLRWEGVPHAWDSMVGNIREADLFDVVQNILLFLPLGFLIGTAPGAGSRFIAAAAAYGLLLSGTLEFLQVLIPGRFPSLVDIVLNAIGSGLGAWVAIRYRSKLWEDVKDSDV